MFEVGRDYRIVWLEDTSEGSVETYSTFRVADWSAPLLKLTQPSGETIFNTCSPHFVRAEKVLREDEKGPPPKFLVTFVSPDNSKSEPVEYGGENA